MKTQIGDRGVFRIIGEPGDSWPEALSDDLSLPCGLCLKEVPFDYMVDDEIWKVLVPEDLGRSVVCLPCLDRLATAVGVDISGHLMSVSFLGIGKTIMLLPSVVYDWSYCVSIEPEEARANG